MNRFGFEQIPMGDREEMRKDVMVCPKPRRLGLMNHSTTNDHIRPLRWPMNQRLEMGDSNVGSELLDMIFPKGSITEISVSQIASSPPFFSGSPPSRPSNPLGQDEQFNNDNFGQFCPAAPSSSSSSTLITGGFARMKIGHKPAAVRIEGFDCLSRDRNNCSISAVA